jgi:hypothetical protein
LKRGEGRAPRDPLLSVSLDGLNGFDKVAFVQAKYDRNLNRNELLDGCGRMEQHVGTKGAYIWIYEQPRVKVLSPYQVRQMRGNTFEGLQRRSATGLTGRILGCYAGSREWGIPMGPNLRQIIQQRIRQVRASERPRPGVDELPVATAPRRVYRRVSSGIPSCHQRCPVSGRDG